MTISGSARTGSRTIGEALPTANYQLPTTNYKLPHQLPPPPPPPPPPDEPPLNPLPPLLPGVLEMTCETLDENVSMLREKAGAENAAAPRYQPPVATVVSISRNTCAHFSTQPKTIA